MIKNANLFNNILVKIHSHNPVHTPTHINPHTPLHTPPHTTSHPYTHTTSPPTPPPPTQLRRADPILGPEEHEAAPTRGGGGRRGLAY